MGRKPHIDIYKVEDGINTLIYTQSDTCTQWKEVTIPFVVGCDRIQYRIYGEVSSGGIFIDDITICKNLDTVINNRNDCTAIDETKTFIYNVMGIHVNKPYDMLPAGVYIQDGKKFVVL